MKKMKTKRKKKKRSGTSAAFAAGLLLIALVSSAAAAKKKPAPDNSATVSGSVFDDRGYALPDAEVTLAPEAQPKAKPMEAVSDTRGEFVLHVPAGPVRYVVTVQAKGYQSQRKTVAIEDQERVEVTFQLERQSK
jgi:hypothetical protein